MNNFIYEIPTKVYFGENNLKCNLGKEVEKYGNKVLLLYGGGSIKRSGLYEKILEELKMFNIKVYEFSGIQPNPRHTAINDAIKICKDNNIDSILAVGGGSVIDSSKLIACGRYYDGDAWDIVMGKVQISRAMPIVTILTLSATGSEMNGTAVISNVDMNYKKGMKSPLLVPKVSFLDPTITYSVNKYQTACGSFDILSQRTIYVRYSNGRNDENCNKIF